MKRRVAFLGLALLSAVCLAAPGARADDASLGRSGETVFPISEPTVRMAAEDVLLKIGPGGTRVDLSFTFANVGPAKSVLMGFPLQEKLEGRGHPELNDFHTWIDGHELPVKTQSAVPGAPYPGWLTWAVEFGADQSRTVKNSYWGTNSYWSNGDVMAGYILKTGAFWMGNIGRATVRAKLEALLPPDLESVQPTDYRWEGDDLVWEWRDFEPESDIAVRWNMRSYELQQPGTADLAPLRQAYLAGDHAAVQTGVKQALAAGRQESLLAYLAVTEGLRKPEDALGWPGLNAPTIRWLQDRAGLNGQPPATPQIKFREVAPPAIPDLVVTLSDPDGDIARWGARVWLQPDQSLTPIATAPADDSWSLRDQAQMELSVPISGWVMSDEVWADVWVVDGRGHRQETGLVKLSVPAGLKPSQQNDMISPIVLPPAQPPQSEPPAPERDRSTGLWISFVAAAILLGVGIGVGARSRKAR